MFTHYLLSILALFLTSTSLTTCAPVNSAITNGPSCPRETNAYPKSLIITFNSDNDNDNDNDNDINTNNTRLRRRSNRLSKRDRINHVLSNVFSDATFGIQSTNDNNTSTSTSKPYTEFSIGSSFHAMKITVNSRQECTNLLNLHLHSSSFGTNDSPIRAVEPDSKVWLHDIQTNAPWHLDRIDQRSLPLDREFHHSPFAGEGVDVFVLDTGTTPTHQEFRHGNTVWGATIAGEKGIDEISHGTFVSGLINGESVGVARKARVIAVKVIAKRFGSASTVLGGLDWVASKVIGNPTYTSGKRRAVIHMSLGGDQESTLSRAVESLLDTGLFHIIVSAGNSHADAAEYSPAKLGSDTPVIVVGSTNVNDDFSSFSNFGHSVSILAPGEDVVSADVNGGYRKASGTSFSAPLLTAQVATLLSDPEYQDVWFSPGGMKDVVLDMATRGAVGNVPEGTANLLMFARP